MRAGIQDDTSLNGHVDKYLDGTIQWTFVSLMLAYSSPQTQVNPMIQVSQYGNVIWMSVPPSASFPC